MKTVKGPLQPKSNPQDKKKDDGGPLESAEKFAGSEFKIYDFNYYKDEVDIFEEWYVGELSLGSIKINR